MSDAVLHRGPAAAARAAVPPRPPAVARAVRRFWHRRSIASQLLLIVIAIDVLAGLLAGGVTILKARTSTGVEIEASFSVAERLVHEALRLVREDTPAPRVLDGLPLQLGHLRHVRMSVHDAAGVAVAARAGADDGRSAAEPERPPAPAWFRTLIAPPIRSEAIPVVARGQEIGSVVLVSEPADEIAEVWENTVALGVVALMVNLAILGVLNILFRRALAPLAGFGRGLIDLERRNYTVRLPVPQAQEFVALTDRFNALAAALAAARADNVDLSRRLISAQDDERRRTARELHDEVGPCLFGLKATAASMAGGAGQPAAGGVVAQRARDMLEIIDHLQVINRNLLNRLRPMALGHVPLKDLLDRIVRDRGREHPHLALSLQAGELAAGYGDAVDLTVYRCVQESLTNAIRHAQATWVRVTLAETRDRQPPCAVAAARVALAVEDDGRGFAGDATPWGFGLRGMQERVVALGGEFAIARRAGGGTIVRVEIPLAPPEQASGRAGGAS